MNNTNSMRIRGIYDTVLRVISQKVCASNGLKETQFIAYTVGLLWCGISLT